LLFWTISWEPRKLTETSELRAKLQVIAKAGHKLILNVVPCPVPNVPGWSRLVGGPSLDWFRPNFRLWDAIQETTQMQIDLVVSEWKRLGRSKADLRFEWFNEPATGHVSGSKKPEPIGTWSLEFHAMCNHLLLHEGGIQFQGHALMGPTVSFLGDPGAEDVEIRTAPGGNLAKWWSRIDQRAMNGGVYSKTQITNPEQAAILWVSALAQRVETLRKLDIPVQNDHISIHEWYVNQPRLGYFKPPYDESLRSECLLAIGERLPQIPHLETAIFYSLLKPSNTTNQYDIHDCESAASFAALCKYVSGN